MKTNVFQKVLENGKNLFGPPKLSPNGKGPQSGDLFKAMPSWPRVIFAYLVAGAVWMASEKYIPLLKEPAYEVCKNLRGLPLAWADLALAWSEKGLKAVAVTMALYHQLWQLGTRYKLTANSVHVEHWFPQREATLVPYAVVRKATLRQDPLDLLLWSGSVEIDTGAGPLVLESCPNPARLFRLLQAKVEAAAPPLDELAAKNKNAARN
jgi:membrane protein YdbS with pleckstrin-like domain